MPTPETGRCAKVTMADKTFDAVIVGGGTKDLDLPKPWEEPGKEEPESLYEQWKIINQKIREIPRKKG